MFIQRVRIYPAPGKGEEFRTALEELVKKLQGQGLATSLSEQLYSPEGATFVSSTKFRDLAEVESRRRQLRADRTYQAAVVKISSLTRAPAKWELYEVLVNYPS